MRIVIEIDGDKVKAITTESPAGTPVEGHAPPGPAPAALLERAKKLGAMSAGPASYGIGAALAATAQAGEKLEMPQSKRAKKSRKRP